MTVFSWLWAVWGVAFFAVEGVALVAKDRPSRPATLSANIRWLVNGSGRWHQVARAALVLGLAWLGPHLLEG